MMPWREALAVVRVFAKAMWQHGNAAGWKTRDKEYVEALKGHLWAHTIHKLQRDEESGEHPLAHVAANALIIMWRERNR